MNAAPDRTFDGVLFDWCGTLVAYPTLADRFRTALMRSGRPYGDEAVATIVGAYQRAAQQPAVLEAAAVGDLSAENHRTAKMLTCDLAGIDPDVAVELQQSYGDLETYPTHPEVVDVIHTLARGGVQIAIVSDLHVDLRPHFASLGLADIVSAFALSFEVGATKPDPRMFQAALDQIELTPTQCLMVGDNPGPDGGAAGLGIATLILPVQLQRRPRLLDRVVDLALPHATRRSGHDEGAPCSSVQGSG